MATVRQRKEPSKKTGKKPWYVDYVDQGGVRRQETPKSGLKRDAEAMRVRIEAEVERGEHVPQQCTLTVREVTLLFLKEQHQRADDGRIGRGRLVNLEIAMNKTVNPVIGAIQISKLTALDVERIYATAAGGKVLAPFTARQRIKDFKMVQDFAIKHGYMKTRPVDDVLRDLKGITYQPIRRFTPDQVVLLLEKSRERRPRCRQRSTVLTCLLMHFAAFAGLRFGEIIGFKMENIDLANSRLRIKNSMSRYDGLKGPKSQAGYRTFPMPTPLREVIEEWLSEYYIENEHGLLICSSGGNPTKLAWFHDDHWKPLLRSCGLGKEGDEFHFHALRGYAISVAAKHVPITDLPRMFGHKHLDVTLQHYLHELMSDTDKAEAVDKMAADILASGRPARDKNAGI